MSKGDVVRTGWERAPLSELLEYVIGGDWGKAPDHADRDYVQVLCIRASEVKNWKTDKGRTAALRSIKRSSLEARRLREGDIVIEISGGGPEQPVGRTLLIDRESLAHSSDVPKICTNFFRLMRPSTHVSSKYLQLFLEHFYNSRDMGRYQGGSNNLRNLKFNEYQKIEVPIAPSQEQLRIVAKIEDLVSELDKGVESLEAARVQLKAYRQAVLKDAFENRKAGSGAAWRPTRLGDEIQFLTSGSRGWADYYASAGDTFVRAQNLKNDRLDLTDIAFVKLPPGNTEGLRTRVKVGDVLITITGANVTKTGIVSSDLGAAYVSQHVALCRPSTSLEPAFLYWYLLSEAHGRRQLNEAAYGAGKPGLNLDNIRDVRLPLPSTEEQVRIVERIDTALTEETRLLAKLEDELQRTEALRRSILTQAFSGRLVAQDPRDEAASSLLDRIRSERKDERAPKKIRKGKNGRKEAA